MLSFHFASKKDVDLYFKWANDETTRKNSYNKEFIEHSNHVKWFETKVASDLSKMYLFTDDKNDNIGQVRIELEPEKQEAIIGISIDSDHRGKGYSAEMIKIASEDFFNSHSAYTIYAFVFCENIPSYKSFIKAGYVLFEQKEIHSIPSYILIKKQ